MTSSRTEAPLAQCEPRLIGISQLGSWPIHTPFATSAVTVQPTEQCVQTLLRMVTAAPVSGRRAGFGLAHAGERQRAERGKAAGGEAGAAQEGAAIEAAADWLARRGERAAARLAFCSFDQHGCLPHFG